MSEQDKFTLFGTLVFATVFIAVLYVSIKDWMKRK